MKYIIIAAIVPVIVAIVVSLAQSGKSERGGFFESPEKRAGRNGEKYATHVIKNALIRMICCSPMFAFSLMASARSLII